MGGDYFALCLALEELARVDSSVAITLEAAVLARRDADLPVRHRGAEARVAAAAVLGRGARRVRPDRAGRRLGRRRDADDRARSTATSGSSTAPRRSSPTPAPTSPARHGHRGDRRAAGRPQGDLDDPRARRARRASRCRRSTPRSAGTPPTPASCRSTTAGCRRRTCSASAAAATPSSCRILDEGRIAIAALAVGLAQGCVDESVKYAKEREAFGRPIGAQPGDRSSRSPTWRCGRTPPGWPTTTRPRGCCAASRSRSRRRSPSCTPRRSRSTNAREATQVHGGYGFMNEFPVARI